MPCSFRVRWREPYLARIGKLTETRSPSSSFAFRAPGEYLRDLVRRPLPDASRTRERLVKTVTLETVHEILARISELEEENHYMRRLVEAAEGKADFFASADVLHSNACPWCLRTRSSEDPDRVAHDVCCHAFDGEERVRSKAP